MRPKAPALQNAVDAWLARTRPELAAKRQRRERAAARRQAEREHFGPRGRPKADVSHRPATEIEEGDPA